MYTLITGATGLVGRYLVRDLLINGHRLAVVVRASKKLCPHQRMEQILQHWEGELGRPLPRPVVLEGNISEEAFGLSQDDQDWVLHNVDKIIHSAAILEFYGEDRAGEPWRTNLGGTRHMINLCRNLKIHDIHYVSTAYVAGMQEDRVMEDSLEAGQSFRNDYEESKYLAEQEVRAIDFADHVTVYRPAVISGDSVTGYTNTYHGIYLYLRLMALMIPSLPADENGVRQTPIRLKMDGNERRNIIPVDWVSAVMVRIFESDEARDGTYHMAPDKAMTSGEMITWCAEYFNASGATLCGHDFEPTRDRDMDEDQWMFEQMVTENMGTYEPYERTDNVFDMTQTKKFAGDIVCPEIDRTVLHRYIDFGNQDRWGKGRMSAPEVPFYATELKNTSTLESGDVVGFDLLGAGGGQLSLAISAEGELRISTGLPHSESTPCIRLSNTELADVLSGKSQFSEFVEPETARAAAAILDALRAKLSKEPQLV